MKVPRKSRLKLTVLFTLGILLSTFLGYQYALASNGSATYTVQSPDALVKSGSAYIFKSGSTIYAVNGTTGERITSGTVAATVIQSAANSLADGGYGVLYIKKANLDITAQLNFSDVKVYIEADSTWTFKHTSSPGITVEDGAIIGDGGKVSFILWSGALTPLIRIQDTTSGKCRLENLRLYGADKAGSVGIEFYAPNAGAVGNPILRNLHVYKFQENLRTNQAGTGYVNRIYADNCIFSLATAGTGYGLNLTTGSGHIFRACEIAQNDRGLRYNASRATFVGCTWDGNSAYDIELLTGHTGLSLDGCTVWQSTQNKILTGSLVASDMLDFQGDYKGSNIGIARNKANGGTQAHGLAATPRNVQVTCLNATYDGEAVNVYWDELNTDSTNISFDVYWANGTTISDAVIDISWIAEV